MTLSCSDNRLVYVYLGALSSQLPHIYSFISLLTKTDENRITENVNTFSYLFLGATPLTELQKLLWSFEQIFLQPIVLAMNLEALLPTKGKKVVCSFSALV